MNINITNDDFDLLRILLSQKLNNLHGLMIKADEMEDEENLQELVKEHNKYLELYKKITQ